MRDRRESSKTSHRCRWSHRFRKSTLSIELALELAAKSSTPLLVQVYSGIQIATAKVPLTERRGVPHHLIDFVPPEINYTAGDWAREAATKIEEIERRGNIPILAGGTGLYLRALRRPFFTSPPTDPSLRRRLTAIRERHGAEHLHRLLQRLAPFRLGLYPRDWPRVHRALKYAADRSPLSAQKEVRLNHPKYSSAAPLALIRRVNFCPRS